MPYGDIHLQKKYAINCIVAIRVTNQLDFQNLPSALMEFVYQPIMYKCLAMPVFKNCLSFLLMLCKVHVKHMKPTFHSNIATIQITITVE